MMAAALTLASARAQTSFAAAQVLPNDVWGSVTNDNTGVVADVGAPNVAGFPTNAPLWYQWTAPMDGVVELDTVGSTFAFSFLNGFYPLDTVLGVYTGASVSQLNQIAANDDLFPINQLESQPIYQASGDYIGLRQYTGGRPYTSTDLPYYGPSHLRFNAKAGVTYYFCEDSKNLTTSQGTFSETGSLVLNWAYQASGVFRFASEDIDPSTSLPLYQAANTESDPPNGLGNDANSVLVTYYQYNAPGVLVTVTRSAGSTGRVRLDYTTVDGTNLVGYVPANDLPATSGKDFYPASGTLVFDDYEMSKTILIKLPYSYNQNYRGSNQLNRVFGIQLSNPVLDDYESGDVAAPRLDPVASLALVRILNTDADPYGPDMVEQVTTDPSGNSVTNQVVAQYPTNVIFNFEKTSYRIPADVNDTNVSKWTQVTVYVQRGGTNGAAATVNYRVNNFLGNDQDASEERNDWFGLKPASDYAVPTPPDVSVRGTNSDFDLAQGTLSFPDSGPGANYQPIRFSIPTSKLTKFNKDFKIQLYREVTINNVTRPQLVGMANEATVTILFNDQNPPAGSVDEFFNADFNTQMALYSAQVPQTDPQDDENPGVGQYGQVYCMSILGNDEILIGGAFASYNGYPRNSIALVNTNGLLDSSFNPGTGANGAINAVGAYGGQFYIGGEFTSYNSSLVGRVARLNANGTLDGSFSPGLGADGTVRTLVVRPSGKILIAGDFTHVNGIGRNHIALLDTTGAADGSFDPTNTFDGPIYAVTLQPDGKILVGGDFNVTGQNYKNIVRLNRDGSIDPTFDTGTGANGIVRTISVQSNGQVIIGGEFTQINGVSLNRLARLNSDGSIDAGFYIGTGADDTLYSANYYEKIMADISVVSNSVDGTLATNITYTTNNAIYVGGAFANFNGTHRRGFTRLYMDGTVDTTFMDTAYNQFAGLKRVYSWDVPAVFSSAVQSDGNVLIGGSFDQVGGGQANTNVCNTLDQRRFISKSFDDPNLWVEPKTRDGVRNRSGFARLIGGATPGPGNIGFSQTAFSANRSQTSVAVALVRTNGNLGPVEANFSVIPGLAKSGVDYTYDSAPPAFWIAWEYLTHPARVRTDGLAGQSGFLIDPYGLYLTLADSYYNDLSKVTVKLKSTSSQGNLNAQFQLANPVTSDYFYLGGQTIPVGTALGVSTAALTLVDDTTYPGTFGFTSPEYVATNLSPSISVVRSNGTYGIVSMKYSTSNLTAVAGTDYVAINGQNLVFGQNVVSNSFNVAVKNNSYITNKEKTVNLRLSNLGTTPGATFGISNAVLRIINPNYQGYVTLGSSNYSGTISSGVANLVVKRVSGSLGTLTVRYATTDGTAVSGSDYIGATNTLTWNSGDVSPKIVSIPLINSGLIAPNKQFGIVLSDPTLNGTANASLMGQITNGLVTIVNDNSAGTLQFSAPSYLVDETGGYATITVVRVGGVSGEISAHYATVDGTAINGTNYTGVGGTVTLSAGQSSAAITIPIINDGVKNPAPSDFYFSVTMNGPGIVANTTVHILDAQTYNQPAGSPDPSFTPDGMNGDVFALALQSNGQILAGGNFTAVGPVLKNRIARLNTDGSLDASFLQGYSGPNAAVNSIVCQTDDRILVGGAFTAINDVYRNFVARLMTDGSLDTSFNPGAAADNTVNAVGEGFWGNVRKIFVGGAFGSFNGFSSSGIVRLNNDGSVDPTFNVGSGVNGPVFAIKAYPTNSVNSGKVLIGGSFTLYNGFAVTNLARLNADGSLDTNFVSKLGSGPDDVVNALAIQSGDQVLVGGAFTHFNGTSINHIVRLNPDGTIDTGFVSAVGAGANGVVENIALQPDNRIVLAGQFSQASGLTRNHITRLFSTGAPDPTINFGLGANGDVSAVVVQPADGMLVIGGSFTTFDNQPFPSIARIYGGSMTGSGAFTFTTGNFSVDERGLVAPIYIRRTGGTSGTNSDLSGNVGVDFATVGGGTAVDGINYLSVSTNVVFPAGEVLKTVLVPVLDDFVVSPDLTVNLALSNPTPPATNGVQPTATLTIVNSDSTLAFSASSYTQAKNAPTGVAIIDVIRSGGTNTTSTVEFNTTTNGTAVIGTDYYPTNVQVTFSPGQSDAQVAVSVINNTIPSGNKTVALVLTNAANAFLTSPSNALLTIIDTVAAPGQLFFTATNFSANEGDGNAYLTVVRTNGSSGIVSASVNVVPLTALPGLNYTAPNSTITFGNGETVKNVVVPLVDNNVVQGPVQLALFLSNPTGGATLTDPTNTALTIVDNDTGYAFLNATNIVRETNGVVPIIVQRLGGTNAGVHVDYSTVNGTALAGVNFTAISGTLNFGEGEVTKVISLPLIHDTNVTGDLGFLLKLSNPSAGTYLAYPTNSFIVEQDAEAGFKFTNSTMQVYKNVGNAVVTVICSNPSIEPPVTDTNRPPLAVSFATMDGTALAGVDYQGTNGVILFTNGIGTNTISIPIYNNSQVTGDHAFTVHLLNPTSPGKLIFPNVMTVTIVDNNSGLSFSSPVYRILRSGVSTNITVLRTDYTNTTSTVRFATADGTAVSGLDYMSTNGVLVFTNGVTSQSFAVTVLANTTVQPDKTVLLQLFDPTNGILIAPYAATLTIHDTSGSLVVPAGSAFAAGGDPNGNGLIDPGEQVTLMLALRASGGTNITDVQATLLSTNGITSPSGPQDYGSLVVGGGSVSRPFTFTANATNSQTIAATLLLNNGVADIGTAVFTYSVGMWTNVFYNTNAIIIKDNAMASPYPSGILVTNVGGLLIKSTVTLTNLFHGYTKDIEALVVSPAGQDTLLMSHAGNSSVSKITLTFDDAATNSLPSTGTLTTGTNKPTSYPSTTVFP